MGLRTRNDLVPKGERMFMLVSTMIALEEGDVPVKIKDFSPKDKKK